MGDPHQNSLKTGSSMKFTISCKNLFKYSSKLVKYWRYGSKSMKEVTLYVDLLICMFCRGSNITGYFPFPSRVGSRHRYGFSFCMVCTRGPVIPRSVGLLGYPRGLPPQTKRLFRELSGQSCSWHTTVPAIRQRNALVSL